MFCKTTSHWQCRQYRMLQVQITWLNDHDVILDDTNINFLQNIPNRQLITHPLRQGVKHHLVNEITIPFLGFPNASLYMMLFYNWLRFLKIKLLFYYCHSVASNTIVYFLQYISVTSLLLVLDRYMLVRIGQYHACSCTGSFHDIGKIIMLAM